MLTAFGEGKVCEAVPAALDNPCEQSGEMLTFPLPPVTPQRRRRRTASPGRYDATPVVSSCEPPVSMLVDPHHPSALEIETELKAQGWERRHEFDRSGMEIWQRRDAHLKADATQRLLGSASRRLRSRSPRSPLMKGLKSPSKLHVPAPASQVVGIARTGSPRPFLSRLATALSRKRRFLGAAL
eukprot:TRINITY_DN26189_c0_g1_i1.p1 TRINITY_DN26189_c0_g1~~TRINITY_DN26189_c0_g1_i1.p1  ORF type:complete len:184 (+),score=34.71 TRINITY_DN26189_c0_g1_i1:70-621(+)